MSINKNKIDDVGANAGEPKEQEAELKKIEELKTLDDLLNKYYVIPKVIKLSNNIIKVLEAECIKTKSRTNINLVKRGKRKKRISSEQQELIRNSNKTNEELSKIYNVSPSTISNIKNNKY
ncbi:MAG: hypothetical protein MSA89_07580 [Clostridium sp.]|nr:hypothetical protein [Clostridium sp.]